MRYDGNNGFVRGDDFNIYCKESFNQLLSETDDGSLRMMSIGLHPRIIGRPGRIIGLEDFIKYIKTYENVWIPKRMVIAKYCLEKDSFNLLTRRTSHPERNPKILRQNSLRKSFLEIIQIMTGGSKYCL